MVYPIVPEFVLTASLEVVVVLDSWVLEAGELFSIKPLVRSEVAVAVKEEEKLEVVNLVREIGIVDESMSVE